MNETEKDRQHLGLEEQCAPDLTGHRFPIAVRVADMPDDLGKLLQLRLPSFLPLGEYIVATEPGFLENSRHVPFLLGLVMNLVGDLMYVVIDPRIDFEGRHV